LLDLEIELSFAVGNTALCGLAQATRSKLQRFLLWKINGKSIAASAETVKIATAC
jgi:hypothetical protein